jgi:lipopolysaccharide biosynthesis protein
MTILRKLGTLYHWLLDDEKSIKDFRKQVTWKEEKLIIEAGRRDNHQPMALTAHVFYEEFAEEIINALKNLSGISKVYLTTPSTHIQQTLEKYLSKSNFAYEIRITPNVGRNFGPLFVEYSADLQKETSFIHVHSKQSLHSPELGLEWLSRNTNLLLTKEGTERIRRLSASDPEIGLVFVDSSDLLYGSNFRWGRSRGLARRLFANLPGFEKIKWSGRLSFPAGGMFWVRTDAIRPLLEVDWDYGMFPPEQGQRDGTLQHALERLVGQIPLSRNFKQALHLKQLDRFKFVEPED